MRWTPSISISIMTSGLQFPNRFQTSRLSGFFLSPESTVHMILVKRARVSFLSSCLFRVCFWTASTCHFFACDMWWPLLCPKANNWDVGPTFQDIHRPSPAGVGNGYTDVSDVRQNLIVLLKYPYEVSITVMRTVLIV